MLSEGRIFAQRSAFPEYTDPKSLAVSFLLYASSVGNIYVIMIVAWSLCAWDLGDVASRFPFR